LNNNLQFSSRDEYRYHEALVHPVLSKAKRIDNILILGGGDGLALREILKYQQVQHITLVDLDPEVTRFFRSNETMKKLNQNSLNNSKVEVVNSDAFIWVKNCVDKYDAVIIDFPDPSNYSLGKLYTLQFYQYLQKITHEKSVIGVQSTSPYFAPKTFWCINKTLEQVFPFSVPYHAYIPAFGEWGFTVAGAQPIPQKNYQSVKGNKFYDFNLSRLSYFSQDMKAQNLEINRLDNQILVRYFDEEWSQF
jgi:spermidine synthase